MGTEKAIPGSYYQIMSDQPDCCGKCGSRLVLVDATHIDGERAFLSHCKCCQTEVLIVEG